MNPTIQSAVNQIREQLATLVAPIVENQEPPQTFEDKAKACNTAVTPLLDDIDTENV